MDQPRAGRLEQSFDAAGEAGDDAVLPGDGAGKINGRAGGGDAERRAAVK